jgi:hypothetical protein
MSGAIAAGRKYERETPMKYLLMIYQTEQAAELLDEASRNAMMAEYGKLTAGLHETGQYRAGERLKSVSTATTVRVRDGKTMTTDGPFAETREQLAGFYMVEAEHLDDAIAIAARIPSARFGSIEVRPIWPTPGATQ